MAENADKKDRNPRTFKALEENLTRLGKRFEDLDNHVHALTSITGLTADQLKSDTAPQEEGVTISHMEKCFSLVSELNRWAQELDEKFRRQLEELVPDWYASKVKEII